MPVFLFGSPVAPVTGATGLPRQRFFCRATCAAVLLLVLAAAASADGQTLYKRVLQSSGWINCPQPDGSNSWGTCWIVDRDERLVVTNKHVIGKASRVLIDFPLYESGKVVTRVAAYLKVAPRNGKIVAVDAKRDLALCRVEAIPADMRALEMAPSVAAAGNKIFLLGNAGANTPLQDEAVLWRWAWGIVESRYFDVSAFSGAGDQKLEALTVRGTLATGRGDSGAPIVNTAGQLVAVHSNGDKLHNYSIDVVELRTFLQRALDSRRWQPVPHDVVGTWTLSSKSAAGTVYWSLTVHASGKCLLERDTAWEGTFAQADIPDTVRLAIPGAGLQGEVALTWTGDDQFSFTCKAQQFTAVRR